MKKLKVAVIGCGGISIMHLDSAEAIDYAEIVAVCDIDEEKAITASKKYHTKYYTDYNEMLNHEKLDVVHICLPHYLHTTVAQEALKHGINVISEKPMSINYKDAINTVELADKLNLTYGVIFQSRYNSPSVLVKKRIDDGKLGEVACARVVLTWHRPDNYYDSSNWKGTWDKEGGGVVIDQAIHSLDLANWFINSEPIEVQSTLHNRNHKSMIVEDTAEGVIKYKNGSLLSFYAMNNYFVDEPIEIRLFCKNGNARLSYDKAIIEYNDGSVETIDNDNKNSTIYSGGKDYWGSHHITQINQYYQSVLGDEKLEISGKEALKIQKIICSIYDNDDNHFKNTNMK